MNIFAVDNNPHIAAQCLVDKHIIKMVLETSQLLSTAHRLLDGEEYIGQSKTGRKAKRWRLPDRREDQLYSATHINHPSAVWCRQSNNNYTWLYCHLVGLLDEYTYRYGKVHKCGGMIPYLVIPPNNIPVGPLTPVTPAMLDEYKVGVDSLASYRNYYKHGKTHLHKWTKREMPEWMK